MPEYWSKKTAINVEFGFVHSTFLSTYVRLRTTANRHFGGGLTLANSEDAPSGDGVIMALLGGSRVVKADSYNRQSNGRDILNS